MRKILSFLLMALFSVGMWAKEGGTLTSTTTPIDPTQTVTLTYDGTGTNFANWTPLCFIHTWLVPANEQTFSKDYGTSWANCNGDGDYAALDAKVKMTYAGTAGKYTISMNIKEFFGVAEADLAKIAKIGVIVRTQYSGDNNQTNDFFLNVSASGEEPEPAIIKMHGNFTGSWADTKNFALAGDKKTATLSLNLEKGNYEFGVKVDGTWISNGVAFNRTNKSAEVVAGSGNLTLDADTKGEYTFTWTYATKTLSIEYPEFVPSLSVIKISGTWDEWAAQRTLEPAANEKTASVEMELPVGVYEFKIIKDGAWKTKANGGSAYGLHREWPGVAGVTDNVTENLKVTVDKAGTHTFTWTYANDSIGIAFPELVSSAVTVTAPEHGTITVKNGEDAIGEKVQEGTVLTVSAASKDAAAYDIINLRAYKTGEPATTVEIKNGQLTMPAYPITITADEEEVVYQTIYFVNKDAWTTVKAYVYLDDDHKYKAWPGEAMTKTEEKAKGKDVYSYRFPAKYTKIIFNDGDTKQTENHTWNASKPYICNGLDYATAEKVVLDATAKYYIVGNAAVMGEWDPTAVPSAAEEYVIANLPAGDYAFRLSLDGTWNKTKGFSDLKTPVAAGLKAGNDNNICFTLKETSDVTITYNGTTFTVTGNFYYRVPVLKDLLFVPGVWAEEDAKIAAWIWTRKEGHEMEDQWTAFFAPKSKDNDTLSVKLDADADSIVFVRFNKTAEAPSWEDKQDFRWNSLAGDTIDKIDLTYTITGWSEGTWDPYIPAKYYLTGDSALVVDAGLDKAKAWNSDAIKATEETYVIKNLKAGQHYSLKLIDGEKWNGYNELTSKALGLRTDDDNNIIIVLDKAGDVTVTYKDKVFTVEGDFAMPTVAIAGNVTGWSPVEMELAKNKLSASVTLKNLEFGLDSFKIVLDGNWISKNGEGESFYTFHRGWNEDKDIKGGDRNMILDRDNAGDYTFTWVFANDSLHIAFPAAPDTATIYFVNTNKDWTAKIYAHAFVGKKGYQTWPGVEMTNTGEKVWEKAIYSAKVPVTYSSVIFNNGEAQTATYTWTKAKPYFCDGTWYANKEAIPEIEPAKYYITGNAALVAYAGLDAESAWNAKAIKVTKDTFVFENLATGYYLMKVVTKDAEPNWIGYDRLTEKSKGLLDAEDHQIGFTMEQAGNVTVVYKEGVFVVKGDYAKLPKVGLAANFNGWNWAENLLVPAKDSLSASLKVNLGVTDTIRFKMVSDNKWLSLNGEGESEYGIHRAWPSAAHVNTVDGRNFALTTDKAGDYIFTWTYADSTITVTFPELESFAVTVTAPTNGTITVKNGKDAIGEKVQEGTELTVTAVANDPAVYEIKNLRAYKTGEPATTVEINNGKLIMPAYPITITADEEKIVYQTLYFVDKEGWNGVNAYVFVDEHAVYKIWPGEAMKKEDRKVKEKDLYSYTFPAKYTKIIFNKKDNTETQTGDMLWNAATPYYCNGFWYESEEAVVLDATAKYYITGDNALMGIWNPAAIKVAEDSYTFPNLPAGTYRMKITLEGTWEKGKVKGYSDLTVQDPAFDTNGENDIIFKLNEAGDVTVTYNAKTFTVTGNFAQKEYYIAGTFTKWAKEMVKMTEKDGNYAATIDIADIAEDPQFKVVYVHGADSVWYGLKSYSAMTSDNCSNWEIGGGEANIGIKPTMAGKYSFYFNPDGLFLTVEMPSQGGGTALDNIRATEKAQKVIINGQLLILYNERMYNVQGQTVK